MRARHWAVPGRTARCLQPHAVVPQRVVGWCRTILGVVRPSVRHGGSVGLDAISRGSAPPYAPFCGGVDRNRLPTYGMHPRERVKTGLAADDFVHFPRLINSKCRMHSLARGMEPLTIDRTHILVLNYNGRGLLADCLPSIVAAARCSPVPCRVTIRRQRFRRWIARTRRSGVAERRLRQ